MGSDSPFRFPISTPAYSLEAICRSVFPNRPLLELRSDSLFRFLYSTPAYSLEVICRSVFPNRPPTRTGKRFAVPFSQIDSRLELGSKSPFHFWGCPCHPLNRNLEELLRACFLTDLWRAVPLVDGGAQTIPFGTWKCFPVPFLRVPVAPLGMALVRASAFQIRGMFRACFLTDFPVPF